MKTMKKIVMALLCVLFLNGTTMALSAEETGAANWEVFNVNLEHTSISFSLANVEMAQDAVIHIADAASGKEWQIPFSITSASANFSMNFPDNQYITAGTYDVYIKDAKGNVTGTVTDTLYSHMLSISGNAYPCGIQAKVTYGSVSSVTATVGFQEYKGTIDAEGKISIVYPKQEAGTIINVVCYDAYGCSEEYSWTIKNKSMSIPGIRVWRDGINLYFDSLDADERLCAEVGNQIYYSAYGCQYSSGSTKILSYPAISGNITKISVWVESTLGSLTEKKEYSISACELENCYFYYKISAYPAKAIGKIGANVYGQLPSKVSVILNNQIYSTSISQTGEFELAYPDQPDDTALKLIFEDAHGCSYSVEKSVNNTLVYESVDLLEHSILCTGIEDSIFQYARLVAEINGVQYFSDYATKENGYKVRVSYPKQAPGTVVKVWYQAEDSSKSKVSEYKIYDKASEYDIDVEARTTYTSGAIAFDWESYAKGNVTAVYVEAGGVKYPCSVEEKEYTWEDEEEYELDDMIDSYYYFHTSYPKQALGTKVTIIAEDADGYVVKKSVKLKNVEPKITVDKIEAGAKKVTGKTTGKSSVKIKIGKKTYKGKAKANGNFSIKIKAYKAGTKVKISVETPGGYTGSKTVTVKKVDSSLSLRKYIYKNSKSIQLEVTKGKKDDKIKIKAGGKTYTKKIKSSKKKQKISVNVNGGLSAGSKVKVTLYDKFGTKKDSFTSMVYFGDTIYVGMSAKDVVLTTWGPPVRKNDWGSFEQWIFESGNTTLYVYIEGGVVTSIQKYNY